MIIRPYHIQDKKQTLYLLEQNIPTYFHRSELIDFEAYLEQEREDYFVVEQDRLLIGAGGINYFHTEKKARISWDIVAPENQGKGIGRALLQHRLSFLKMNKDIDTVDVRTSQLTHRFYEKSGFILIDKKTDYWAPGFDLYHMRKKN
ncbi:MAG: GNAT family N-acetyltransferase [Saprospiraceae bacterium]|nr:GNAT family N-acetyltransferase [Saprospiraceae bacterium]